MLAPSPESAPPLSDKISFQRKLVVFEVALALFVDMVVYGVVIPTLPQIVHDKLGMDPTALGFLFASYALGLLLTTPIVGVLSDRYNNRKYPMLAGLLGLAVATIMFGYGQTYTELVLARMGQGVSGGISWTIGLCMIADIYPSSQLGTIMSRVLTANTMGFLGIFLVWFVLLVTVIAIQAGPPIGGILFDYVGPQAPYQFCAALALIDLGCRLFIRTDSAELRETVVSPRENLGLLQESPRQEHYGSIHNLNSSNPQIAPLPEQQKQQQKKATIWTLVADKQVLVTCIAIVFGSGVFSGIEPTLPVVVHKRFDMDPSEIGILYTGIIIPNTIASLVIGHLSDKYGRKNLTAIGILLSALSCFWVGYASTLPSLICSLVFFGLSNAVLMSPTLPEMADFVEKQGGGAYASSYALFNISYSGGMLIGPIVGGIMMDEYGFAMQMVVYAVGLILLCPLVVYFWWISRNEVRHTILASSTI